MSATKFANNRFMTAAEQACKESHILALQAVAESNEAGLIIEDDVFFVTDFLKRLQIAISELPDNWDGIWFGGYEKRKSDPHGKTTSRIVSQLGAFAYMVTPSFARYLIGELNRNIHLTTDGTYSGLQSKFECYRSVLVGHLAGVSTIQNMYVDYKELRLIR